MHLRQTDTLVVIPRTVVEKVDGETDEVYERRCHVQFMLDTMKHGEQSFQVQFLGADAKREHVKNGLRGGTSPIAVPVDTVLQFLRIMQEVNEHRRLKGGRFTAPELQQFEDYMKTVVDDAVNNMKSDNDPQHANFEDTLSKSSMRPGIPGVGFDHVFLMKSAPDLEGASGKAEYLKLVKEILQPGREAEPTNEYENSRDIILG